MAAIKEGSRVRVATRALNDQDRKVFGQFEHMQGLVGVVENVYSTTEIAVKVDIASLPAIQTSVHKAATQRMREKFTDSVGEEGRKGMTKEELDFVPHYVLLVRETDLELL